MNATNRGVGVGFDPAAWQPYVQALLDYARDGSDRMLTVHDGLGDSDEWPVSHFFRDAPSMPPLEVRALDLAAGSILDVGAGTGCHALELQNRGARVRALEPVPELANLIRQRGVLDVACARLDEQREVFDTVMLLMNGIGLAGTAEGLGGMLETLSGLVAPGGQVLADSTDVTGAYEPPGDGRYVGEWTFRFEYDGVVGAPFPFLYVDPGFLHAAAMATGWHCDIAARDAESHLFRLTRP